MTVLMVGVDSTRKGGMWSVVENYLNDAGFREQTHLTYIPTATHGSVPHRLIFFAKAYRSVLRLVRRRNIDILHIHMAEKGSTFRAGVLLHTARHFGCKTIVHMHGAEFEAWYSRCRRGVRKIIGRILNRADLILLLGSYMKNFIDPLLGRPEKSAVLYNAVEVPEENLFAEDADQILFFALPLQRKGFYDLLRAYRGLEESIREKHRLLVCGVSPEYREAVEAAIEKLQLQGQVLTAGWIGGEEKHAVFSKAMIHILPSYYEGLPMSILETMAYGIPNVSTDIAAIPEVIRSGENGILIRPGDVDGLTEAMRTLTREPQKRMELSGRAYETVKEKFSLQKHKAELIRLYSGLLENNR